MSVEVTRMGFINSHLTGTWEPGDSARRLNESPFRVELSGSTLAEQLTDADASEGVLTFAADLEHVEIYNRDSENDGVFTVNGIDITVPAGEVWTGCVGGTASAEVTVATSTSYIVSRLT